VNIANAFNVRSTSLASRWLPAGVSLLLVIALVLLLADRLPVFDRPEAAKALDLQHGADTTEAANEQHTAYDPENTNMFAKVEDGGDSGNRHPAQLPDTSLQLYLQGVMATDDGRLGYAIIRSSDQQELHFRVGDSVFGLATLEVIYVDRVILRRNGLQETLRLPVGFMAHDIEYAHDREDETRALVSDFRSKLINRDGMALIRMFGFEETYRNGGFVGFTVKIAGEQGADMLAVLGIEEGDVITAVNGKRFADVLDAIQSLPALKDATEVDVEIDRSGVPMFFHFELDQLDAVAAKTGQPSAMPVTSETAARESTALP